MTWSRKSKKDELTKAEQDLYPEVIVDLETLGVGTDAAVLSLGAVRFRLGTVDSASTLESSKRTFYARLDETEQEEDGRTVDPNTLSWWADQSDEARAVFDEEPRPAREVLKDFIRFCKGAKRIWGNSNMFDNAILQDMCEEYDLEFPVGFRSNMDYRTVLHLWRCVTNWRKKFPDVDEDLYDHTALGDAKAETLTLQQMFKDLKNKQRV